MIALIVAHCKNRAIGKDGKIPWCIKSDLKRFRDITMGGAVVMGRKTFESIGAPLEGRLNIVVSNTKEYSKENLITVKSLQEGFEKAKGYDIFIIGGEKIYKEALDYCDKLFVTEVDTVVEADTYFSEFNKDEFHIVESKKVVDTLEYEFTIYERNSAN